MIVLLQSREWIGILPAGFASLWGLVVLGSLVVVHVSFALAVLHDAGRRPGGLSFVGPRMWALATLVGGPFTAAVYWLMHHSTLRRPGAE